jgi:hypothetical protein
MNGGVCWVEVWNLDISGQKEHFFVTAADRRCGISLAPGGLVAGVCQSDSIRSF